MESKQGDAKRAKVELSTRCINTVRVLSADIVQKAKSGHPGAPIGCAPMAYALWGHAMKYAPGAPTWSNRDRFVLSNGHACALLYSMLHLTGYEDMTMDDLKQFRQLGSRTPGHPESFMGKGVEVCTGPLGQGISNAVGLAMAEAHLAARFNKDGFPVVDNYTFVICGDGCLQEGVSSETSSLAGHLGLGKLIVLYDDNNITIDGSTDLSFTEDVGKRYEAYGWHVQTVADGNTGHEDILAAVEAAKAVTDKPSIIKVKTVIGLGAVKENTHKIHGSPLGDADLKTFKTHYGFDPDEFFAVPAEVADFYAGRKAEGQAKFDEWTAMFAEYAAKFPAEAAAFTRMTSGALPDGWADALPKFTPESPTKASRIYSQMVLNSLTAAIPEMVGGSADLTPSNMTLVDEMAIDFQRQTPHGRYIRFGVREHGMSSICNGIAAYGGLLPYCATFLNFVGYALGAVRISALAGHKVIYVMTHDSIGLGEDGPTHQPVESLISLRAMPKMNVVRPADGNETSGAYALALETDGPTTLSLSRQGLPNLATTSIEGVKKGAYVLTECADANLTLVASGSEVSLAMSAVEPLAAAGVKCRVVSMPCWEAFEAQSAEYQRSVLATGSPVLAIEAAAAHGWEKYSHAQICMRSFGTSAPGKAAFSKFGFTTDNVVEKGKALVAHFQGKAVPALLAGPIF